ncbi:MAG TPA: hypothetical protein VER11_16465 [Polyangiaceae bacterium]|nr:hypothetical protein [Polyangiaceae bacterium]
MGSTPALRASALFLLASAFAVGCEVKATGAPDGSASQCRIDTDVLCPGNFVGYSCQGDSKPAPACGAGTLEFDGEVGYCCEVQDTGTCGVDPAVRCTDGSTGYSCTGGVLPNAVDPTLACGQSVAGPNAEELYCCVGAGSTSSCAADASVAGCADGSYGWSCGGTDSPAQGNPSLVCSAATPGDNGSSLYCCISFDSSTGSCVSDANVTGCTGNSAGFSCTGADAPDQTQPSLVCSTGTPGPNDELFYCCSTS